MAEPNPNLHELTSFCEQAPPELHSVLKIPSIFPIVPPPPSLIFCRKCYIEVAENILSLIHVRMEHPTSTIVVVGGTPGIGKTCFLPYLLLYLLENHYNVCFQVATYDQNSYIWYMFTATERKCLCVSIEEMRNYKFGTRVVVIQDMVLTSEPMLASSYLLFRYFTIIAASPDKSRLKPQKYFTNQCLYFMPTWSFEEISACHLAVPEYEATLPQNVLKDRFNRWGGIPQILYRDVMQYNFIEKKYADDIRDPRIVRGLVDRNHGSELCDANFTISCQYLSPMTVSYDYKSYRFDWPSIQIMEEVFHKTKSFDSMYSIRRLLKSSSSNTAYGELYEVCVKKKLQSIVEDHHANPRSDRFSLNLFPTVSRRSTSTSPSQEQVILGENIINSTFSENLSMDDPKKTLFFPLYHNQPTFDCVQPPFLFQITTAKHHSIMEAGLATAITFFKIPESNWKIVFIVPNDRIPYATQKFELNTRTIPQYFTCFDFHENLMNSEEGISLGDSLDFSDSDTD